MKTLYGKRVVETDEFNQIDRLDFSVWALENDFSGYIFDIDDYERSIHHYDNGINLNNDSWSSVYSGGEFFWLNQINGNFVKFSYGTRTLYNSIFFEKINGWHYFNDPRIGVKFDDYNSKFSESLPKYVSKSEFRKKVFRAQEFELLKYLNKDEVIIIPNMPNIQEIINSKLTFNSIEKDIKE